MQVNITYIFMYSSGWTLWLYRWTADLSSKGRWEASRPVCTQRSLPSHPLLCWGSPTTDLQVSHQHLSTYTGCPTSININPYLVTHYRKGILTRKVNDAQKMCQRYSCVKFRWPINLSKLTRCHFRHSSRTHLNISSLFELYQAV